MGGWTVVAQLCIAGYHIPGIFFLQGKHGSFCCCNTCSPEPWITNEISLNGMGNFPCQVYFKGETDEYYYFGISMSVCVKETR